LVANGTDGWVGLDSLAFVGVRSLWIISRISETVDYSPESSLPRVAWSPKTLKINKNKTLLVMSEESWKRLFRIYTCRRFSVVTRAGALLLLLLRVFVMTLVSLLHHPPTIARSLALLLLVAVAAAASFFAATAYLSLSLSPLSHCPFFQYPKSPPLLALAEL